MGHCNDDGGGGYEISIAKAGKYLGFTLDTRRSIRAHIEKVSGITNVMVVQAKPNEGS